MKRYFGNTLKKLGIVLGLWFLLYSPAFGGMAPKAEANQADHLILVVLEGIGNQVIKSGSLPVLDRLVQEGAVTWSAQSITPPLTVPAMASLLTGLPINKHRVTPDWEQYDFARSFLRPPTFFDYMDLAAGKDSAVFLMDERLYQLSRPEIYVDSQVCGYAKPNCTPMLVVGYIRDYLKKVTSEKGYGFRLFAVPDLLLVHFPTAARSGGKHGWESEIYQKAVQEVDTAVGEIIKTYKEFGVLDRSMVLVIGLNADHSNTQTQNGNSKASASNLNQSTIPWIAWGANVKPHYSITRSVSLLDTGATILYALGLKTHTEWQSRAVDEIFEVIPEPRTTENELSAITH